MRERTDELGVSEPEIARIGEDQIEVGLPDVQNAERAIEQVGTTAQLYLYDFERTCIPPRPEASQNATERTFEPPLRRGPVRLRAEGPSAPGPLHDQRPHLLPVRRGLARAARRARRRSRRTCSSTRPTASSRRHRGARRSRRAPSSSRRSRRADDDPATEVDESENAPPSTSCCKDRPELSGDEIEDPKQNSTDQPTSRTSPSTSPTRAAAAFQEVTRRIAQRGAAKAPPSACANPAGRRRLSQHFAIVLDNEIVSRPIINFCENPDGIDGRTGAQISGSFTLTEAQDLAKFLQIGALPVNLTLISQSTVSATLGEEALDQGLKAGLDRPAPRPALPDRLLPRARRGRRPRPARLRALLPTR